MLGRSHTDFSLDTGGNLIKVEGEGLLSGPCVELLPDFRKINGHSALFLQHTVHKVLQAVDELLQLLKSVGLVDILDHNLLLRFHLSHCLDCLYRRLSRLRAYRLRPLERDLNFFLGDAGLVGLLELRPADFLALLSGGSFLQILLPERQPRLQFGPDFLFLPLCLSLCPHKHLPFILRRLVLAALPPLPTNIHLLFIKIFPLVHRSLSVVI